jgi:hypothetical protein
MRCEGRRHGSLRVYRDKPGRGCLIHFGRQEKAQRIHWQGCVDLDGACTILVNDNAQTPRFRPVWYEAVEVFDEGLDILLQEHSGFAPPETFCSF